MFIHFCGSLCIAPSDFVSVKSSRQEYQLWATNVCLILYENVHKKDDFVYSVYYYEVFISLLFLLTNSFDFMYAYVSLIKTNHTSQHKA